MKKRINYATVGEGGRDYSTLNVERYNSSGSVCLMILDSECIATRSVELNRAQQVHLGYWLLNRPEGEDTPEWIPLIQEFD